MNNITLRRQFMAELIGTMFILLFGNGVDAMSLLFNLGGYTDITFGWGIGVLLGILVSGRISGAHLNPAITIALVITKRFPLNKAPYYIMAQMLGGFLGALIVYIFYYAKFQQVDPGLTHSAAVFTTFPALSNTFMPGFIAEIIASFILMFAILSISDHFALTPQSFFVPFAVAGLIVGIGMSFGGMHGYAMNPARDFSPRLLVYLLGFKNTGLDNSYIWLAPVLGSIIGAIFGAIVFDKTLANK
jgi:glycerol uptake facilitator protein